MSNSISDKLQAYWKELPNAINGNGQNFIFLLKNLLKDLSGDLEGKFEEISKIANSITDAPDEMEYQLKDCKVKEVRVGAKISLVLSWDYSDVKNYDSAEIVVKETKGDITTVIDWDEVAVFRKIRTTKTDSVTVDGCNAGYAYQITFRAKDTFGSVSEADKAPTLVYFTSSMNNSPDSPMDFDCYFTREGVTWRWQQPVGVEYSYSELRENEDVGQKKGLLEVTQDNKSNVLPSVREGTAYLFNKGFGSKYSDPITCTWSKPVPEAPKELNVVSTYQGLQFTYSGIPEDCIGICISINGLKHYSQDEKYNYYCSTGTYTYKACFYDCFGEGIWTEEGSIGTEEEIPPNAVHITDKTVFDDGVIVGKYIGDREIVGTKIEEGTITTENIQAGAISTDLLGANSVTTEKMEANSIDGKVIKAGTMDASKITAGTIKAEQIGSGQITADKLAANEIDMAGELKIVGGQVTLDENGLNIECNNGSSVNFGAGGMVFVDSNKNPFTVINRFCAGSCQDGQYIKFNVPWDITPFVMVFPIELQTNAVEYSSSNILQHTFATDITNNGFSVRCYSSLEPNSSGYISVNRAFDKLQSSSQETRTYTYTFDIPTSATWISITMRNEFSYSNSYGHGAHAGTDITITVGNNVYARFHYDVKDDEDQNTLTSFSGTNRVHYESGSSQISNDPVMYSRYASWGYRTVWNSGIPTNAGSLTITFTDIAGRRGDMGSVQNFVDSLQFNTSTETVIHRGKAGFIAINPSSVLYTT